MSRTEELKVVINYLTSEFNDLKSHDPLSETANHLNIALQHALYQQMAIQQTKIKQLEEDKS